MYIISCISIKTHLGDTFSHRESIAYYGGVNTISSTFLVFLGGVIISKLRKFEYCSFIVLYSYFVFFCVICAFVLIRKVIRKFLKKIIFLKKNYFQTTKKIINQIFLTFAAFKKSETQR